MDSILFKMYLYKIIDVFQYIKYFGGQNIRVKTFFYI